MMERIVAIKSIDTIKKLIKYDVSHILINDEYFSSGVDGLEKEEIKDFVLEANKYDLKVIVRVDRLYHQNELSLLENYLKDLNEYGVHAVLFSDLTVKVICDNASLTLQTIYAPETLLTNSYDVKALRDDDFSACVISKDIIADDVYKIASDNDSYCYLRAFGPILIAYSRRRFISLYLKEAKEHKDNYYLQEETRASLLPINEKKTGSWLYGYTLESLQEIDKLKSSALNGLIFDNIFHDDEYIINVLEIYKEVETNNLDYSSALDKLKKLDEKVSYCAFREIKKTILDKE